MAAKFQPIGITFLFLPLFDSSEASRLPKKLGYGDQIFKDTKIFNQTWHPYLSIIATEVWNFDDAEFIYQTLENTPVGAPLLGAISCVVRWPW